MLCKKIKNLNLSVISLSGQCFRLREVESGIYNVLFNDKFVRVEKGKSKDEFLFDCSEEFFEKYLVEYFNLDVDYKKFAKLCDKDDKFLSNCIKVSDGLRILRQDKFETIVSFIISQRKSIKAIETSIERLCTLAGKKIKNDYGVFYAFPTATQILKLSNEELKSIGFGYRQEYIVNFCKNYLIGQYDLDSFEKLSDDELLRNLMEIKGVGIKVASCIALFAYHRLSVCPKDVWIKRVKERKYTGGIPGKYEKDLGIIQQYWFNYAKNYKL